MKSLYIRIKDLFGLSASKPLSLETLQNMFADRYRNFRELLTANNNALEAMARMESVLHDGRVFSMAFIRSNTIEISVNVYKMIQCLTSMADGRYGALKDTFEEIRQQLDTIINQEHTELDGRWFIALEDTTREQVEQVGEKMANLGEAGSIDGINIPTGFIATRSATRYFFLHNDLYTAVNRIIQQKDMGSMEELHKCSHELQTLIRRAPLPVDLEKGLYEQYDLLAGKDHAINLAIRSSALGEDTRSDSFAGLYHTELHVDREELADSYKAVIASTYSTRAMSYRLAKGLLHEETVMSVGCLAMVEAVTSGVCYSRSITGKLEVLDIFHAPGSAGGIVDGTKSAQHLLVKRSPPNEVIGERGGDVSDDSTMMDKVHIKEIAQAAVRLEDHFGSPQDIEWSIDRLGRLNILQSRPISVDVAEQYCEAIDDPPTDNNFLLRGQVTGCPGVAAGPVFVVRSSLDILRFPEQAVLVVEHPLPQWVPLLRKAAALISETGSEAGHLATVAREFYLPAILSTADAMQRLSNGMMITVDATNRTIYRGYIQELFKQEKKKINPMHDSPVMQVMDKALKLITPLNLTDPASARFHSSTCRTMHDITRFCHEKSVVEMFTFGKRFSYKDGVAKRLVDNMPLEWWVINLADGFSENFDQRNKFVDISEIVSKPMLALWTGMNTISWKGPPKVNFNGLGSIIYQSTRRTGVDPATASTLTKRNYFLISKKYCNLSVRLGYHYAMVEAFISDLRTERYVTFRFQGGAADATRRASRVRLLAEILEKYGFRVEILHDNLTARLEKHPQDFLCTRLNILGYLTIHARQIDMVINSPGQYKRYYEKFIIEIEDMLSHANQRTLDITSCAESSCAAGR